MCGGSKAPSLLPKYVMDYVVHKEVVRKVFIKGVSNFLHDMKKEKFPPQPFYIGSYKFTKFKGAFEFVKELEISHFGEKSFHRNENSGKVLEHYATIGIPYEYSDHFNVDEEAYIRGSNMTELSKCFKKKIGIDGSKDTNSETKK